jgi:hypothetical protein
VGTRFIEGLRAIDNPLTEVGQDSDFARLGGWRVPIELEAAWESAAFLVQLPSNNHPPLPMILLSPLVGLSDSRYVRAFLCSCAQPSPSDHTLAFASCTSKHGHDHRHGPRSVAFRGYKDGSGMFQLPQSHILFVTPLPSATLFIHPMVTRGKNKSAHPGIPDMSPAQLLAAGLSHASSTPRRPKQPTKAQEIAALKEELRSIKELVALVLIQFGCTVLR